MDLTLIWKALLIGVVEGLTEFLPVSSSAHLRIVGEFLPHAQDPGAAFTAITLSLVVFWLGYSAGQSSEKNESVLPVLFAFPIFVSILATYALATNRQIGIPVKWTNWVRDFFAGPQAAFAGAGARIFRKRGGRGQ